MAIEILQWNGSLWFTTSFCNLQLLYLFVRMIVPRTPFILGDNVENTSWNPFGVPAAQSLHSAVPVRCRNPLPKNLFHSNFIGGLIKWFYPFFRIRFLHDCISCVLHELGRNERIRLGRVWIANCDPDIGIIAYIKEHKSFWNVFVRPLKRVR